MASTFADHTIATRQGIGFDEGNETYNLEYSYQGDKWSGSLTAVSWGVQTIPA